MDLFAHEVLAMKFSSNSERQIPAALRAALLGFRRRLWAIKLIEAVAGSAIVFFVGYLLIYALDRLHDTSAWIRIGVWLASAASLFAIPVAIQRWVLRRRRFDQLARLLATTRPSYGDPLLGVIELAAENVEAAGSRSPELVQAAIAQVTAEVAGQDLKASLPKSTHRQRVIIATALAGLVLILIGVSPPAAVNAFWRLFVPWNDTPRYTFAQVRALPESLVVAAEEPFAVTVQLDRSSRWKPSSATATIDHRATHQAGRQELTYLFELPGQISSHALQIRVGDFAGDVEIRPQSRPVLSSLQARLELPTYLGRPQPETKELRGKTVSVLAGSTTTLTAKASRPLAGASVNGQARPIDGDQFSSDAMTIDQVTLLQLDWRDTNGLSSKEPFALSVEPVTDAGPTVVAEDLPHRKVLLDREVIKFTVRAADDYGVKRVGLQWRAIDDEDLSPEHGEAIIGAGDVMAEQLELVATFSAAEHQILSPLIAVRAFAEDYRPAGERSYTPESVFEVLNADQHAIWITDQLARWQRMSLDARDRELKLHETNKQLRELAADELRLPENQERLNRQADLERAGGQQLSSLVRNGQGLLQEAMRNPEIGVGHLERWAEMIQTLKQISDNRMPSVAELLSRAAKQAAPTANPNRAAGQNRLTPQPDGEAVPEPGQAPPTASVPTVSDVESTQHDLSAAKSSPSAASSSQQSRLTLPETMLSSPPQPPSGNQPKQLSTPEAPLAQAVREQQDLLAEFDKIADELNDVLANLEGSTIVKRLKASSRRQQHVAAQLASLADDTFGLSERRKESSGQEFQQLAKVQIDSSEQTSHIMDDMDAYFQRSRLLAFRNVLDQMRAADVTAELRLLGEELRKENGLAIAQAEFWSDTFDRWAEDLVGACQSGECPGGKSKGSLPPSVVLEVLKLLEGEVNLREQTRMAEQARNAIEFAAHVATADRLWQSQAELQQRTERVVEQILALPDAESDFAKEVSMLSKVSSIMTETIEILRRPETGSRAIAAETEIIEMLLESKRFSPSGGGGASAPGGGGNGDTETAALALVGAGVNAKESREPMSAISESGVGGTPLPAEYRSGLDAYFNRFESWRSRK
jgi:hypothetical protein